LFLLFISVSFFLLVFVIYLLYFIVIYRNKREVDNYLNILGDLQKSECILPHLSIIVSTFNESKVIQRKIQNISTLNYPKEKLEIIVFDDCSTDGTSEIAQQTLKETCLKGRIIRNPERIGLNRSLNKAFQLASYPIICVTDSDVTLEKDALKNALTILETFDNAGGITGHVVPIHSMNGLAPKFEDDYRSYYERAMLVESSFHSAFPGNGPLLIFRSSPHYSIPPTSGSSDANIAMNVIKKGQRYLYVPNAIIYEPVPETVSQQKLQKVRRASRLIQAFIHNTDVFLNGAYGIFGTLIFPLKFFMHVICPTLSLLGLISFISFITLFADSQLQVLMVGGLVFILAVLAIFGKIRNFLLTFLFHQLYLILGLFSLPKQSTTWKRIERK